MARILVLDGHSAAALAITRSGGRSGHWVGVGANRGLFAAAKLSRYCSASFDYPVSTDDARSFIDSILQIVSAHAIDLVIPVTDWTLAPISQQRDRFAKVCRVAMPSQAAIDFASDKYRTVKLAESLAIDVPATQLVESGKDFSQRIDAQYPLVVKDRFSVRWMQNKAVFGSVAYAYSETELRDKVAERLETAGDVLVQEFVAGTGIGFSCFISGGRVFVPFAWQRVREVDPRGSASSARKSISLDPGLVAQSVRLMAQMQFEGIAMVEYKKTTDGRLVLMEVNGRPWGSIGLPVACGIDYPQYLIDWQMRGKLPPETRSYRENVLCRRLVGELTHLSNIRAGRPANWPAAYPNYWASLASVSIPWRPGMCYDDLWLSDPKPGIAGIRQWFKLRMEKKSRK